MNYKNNIINFIKKWKFILILLLVESVLFITNYHSGTYLVGWDNVYPELNFFANFQRNIFAIWQEYRGLGLLDGMAHAANLPHTVFIFLLSIFIPQNIIRYVFTFFMHLVGGIGAYYLIEKLLSYSSKPQPQNNNNHILSLFGALFYQFNLATIQMFYAPLEVFSFHFAFLPLLLYLIISYLESGKKRAFLLFGLFSLFSIPQAHVPSVFLVYFLAAIAVIFVYTLKNNLRSTAIKRSTVTILTIIVLNAFWGLPYVYTTLHASGTIVNSKINLMSTDNVVSRNKVFGNFMNVALLHGFSFDYVDYQANGANDYMMLSWRNQVSQPVVFAISFLFFIVTVYGLVYSIIKREIDCYPFVILFIFTFLMLGNDIPILSLFSAGLQKFIPLFYDVFRFTFTKFSLLYALCYTIFFAVGLKKIFIIFLQNKKQLITGLIFGLYVSLALYSFPAFQGNFLYSNLKIEIPQSYFQLMDFFNSQNNNNRVATLPQPSYWGWVYYQWGVRGSGFLWYGLSQPTMDGAFYPWSSQDENYYWEISQAVYSNNQSLLENILKKYQIEWVIVDQNIISPFSPKALFTDKLEEIIGSSDNIKLAAVFGKIKVYRVNLITNPKNFVSLTSNLPAVGPEYKWNNYDKAYEEYGNYITQAEGGKNSLSFGSITQSRISNDSNSQSQNSQSKIEKSKIVDVKTHNFTLNNNKLITQKVSATATPHTNITELNLSSAKGMTIVAKATWPISEQISDNRLSWDLFDKSFIDNDNSIESKSLSKDRGFNQVFAADSSVSSTPEESIRTPSEVSSGTLVPDVYYPFRSLFTGRQQDELEFGITANNDYFSFQAKIPKELVGYKLVIPALEEKEIIELDENDLSKLT